MDVNEIAKGGVVGGIVAVVLEFIVGAAAPSIEYGFGFVAILVGGFVAGWMIKGKKMEDGAAGGVVAGLIYVILGLFIIYPIVADYHSSSPILALIVGIVLGAIGGFVGQYLNSGKGKK